MTFLLTLYLYTVDGWVMADQTTFPQQNYSTIEECEYNAEHWNKYIAPLAQVDLGTNYAECSEGT